MDSSNHCSGQAVIELTVTAALVLLATLCCVAVVGSVKKEMKHDFVQPHPSLSSPQVQEDMAQMLHNLENQVGHNMVFYGHKPLSEITSNLEKDGWVKLKKIKDKGDTVIFLSRGENKMTLVVSRSGTLGFSNDH